MSGYIPTAFKPLRSLVANVQFSPSPPPEDQPNPQESSDDTYLADGNIILDDHPMSEAPKRADGQHANSPGVFHPSMVPTVVTTGDGLHVELIPKEEQADKEKKKDNKEDLMLPSHVLLETHLLGEEGQAEGEGDRTAVEDEDFLAGLHFVDDDLTRGSKRYFDPEPEETQDDEAAFLAAADSRKVCQNCKKPGHRSVDCPHVICTTCGAVDEHERRDCPLSKVCYGCGQRGHHKSECPDPATRNKRWTACERCGGSSHTDTNCPTIWRVYTYIRDDERKSVIKEKEKAEGWAKEAMGGGPYEAWCYNCAREGHFGDDCPQRRGSLVRLTAPSAFSYEMSSRGPFYEAPSKAKNLPKATHSRFTDDDVPYNSVYDSYGADAGRRGREKAKQKMISRGGRHDEDEDDWFGGNRERDRRGGQGTPQNRGRGQAGTPQNRGGPAGRDGRRPWDSELRGREWDQDRAKRDHASRNDRDDYDHFERRGGQPPRRQSRSPPARKRGGQSLRDLPPSSAPPKANYRPRLDDRGYADSPSVRGDGRGAEAGAGSRALLARAMGPQGGGSSPRSHDLGASPKPSLKSRIGPAPGGGKRGRDDERDWEGEWRRGGGQGGNVADWGRQMDRDVRDSRDGRGMSIRGSGAKDQQKGTGQKYHGGY
ncbi:hypothetical protein L202_03742 [Cryptococcus amylolentus CBS 6039]|uniref:CCHC-type domain-containing protein n=2 Tax=Cryptococcus amylolentus TaxID=104669 RepID=A0A1E3HU26_9TREE|nr:hypothetical protein L202_03742 [Cryptococcus amylolentus CBS 6039]ODN79848.1 hypothetical protein L202_03742 [Cryptococcus amylolentus CBS 6039]ODO08117.1 hypothetical protein I350_03701 [Cryptococcus amylolentus CBS 6273]